VQRQRGEERTEGPNLSSTVVGRAGRADVRRAGRSELRAVDAWRRRAERQRNANADTRVKRLSVARKPVVNRRQRDAR